MLLLLAFLLPLLPHPTSDAAEMAPPMQILREKAELTLITYLETEIPVVEESIFPAKLEISATLGSLHGILFYSIDKNDHKLVLEGAKIVNKNNLIVRVGQMYYNLILADLCGCSRNCTYETLNLTLETSASTIKIQCNGQPPDMRKFPDKYQIDEDFPRINFSSNTAKNAAHVWMVNIPPLGGLQSAPRQLDGCLHKLKYRDRDLTLSARGPHFRRGCRDVCTTMSGICNMGHCVGTLNDEPVCDCTAALLMGKTCTDKLNTNSTKTFVFKHRFSSLKVSWSSGSSRPILLLQMSDLNITLSSLNDELQLQQRYHTKAGTTVFTRVQLHKYESRRAHTAILRFLGPSISIQMPLDNDLVSVIPLAHNTVHGGVNLTLYSQPGGVADAAFKGDDLVYEWTKIQWKFIPLPLLMPKEGNSAGSSNISKEKMVGIVLGSIVAVVVVAALIVARKRKRKMQQMLQKLLASEEDSAPLLDKDMDMKMDTVDGAALWEFVRSMLRQYGDLKTATAPEERKQSLRKILDNLEMLSKADPSVTKHIKLNRKLLNADEVDMKKLRYHLQMLTLAITNVAIKAPGASAAEPPHVRTLRAVYAKLRHVKAAYVTQDNKVQPWSHSDFIGAVDEIKMTLSTTLDNKSNSEYDRDEFVQRRCSQIEERIQKMEESAACGKKWINHVRSLGGLIQLLMLAIVNVELREGGRSSGGDGPQISSNVGESTSKRNSVSTSPKPSPSDPIDENVNESANEVQRSKIESYQIKPKVEGEVETML